MEPGGGALDNARRGLDFFQDFLVEGNSNSKLINPPGEKKYVGALAADTAWSDFFLFINPQKRGS